MSSKTNIANLAMTRLGEAVFTDVDTDGTNPADVVNAVWDVILEQSLYQGPEDGWRFARKTYHGISRESFTVSSIVQNGTDITITPSAAHTFVEGDEVELSGDTGYDGTYDITTVTGTTTFDVTATFVATGTGTAKWTSEEYEYRYARPTCTRVVNVQVGGIELTDWQRDGSFIVTNGEDTDVDMRYVQAASAVTVTNFPMHFVEVLWRRLASHLAYSLVQNATIQQQLITEMEQVYIPRAIGMDNREQYVKESSDSWVDAGRSSSIIE